MTTTEEKRVYISKPTKFEDLDEGAKRGERVLSIDTSLAAKYPDLMDRVADVIRACQAQGFIRYASYGSSVDYHEAKDSDERYRALVFAQKEWETSRQQYETCLMTRQEPESDVRWRVERFCRAESLDVPWSA